MGRQKDSGKLTLVDLYNGPLPPVEYELIAETNFSVPFDTIKVVDSKEFNIPGLWTPQEAVKDKWLSQKNIFPVNVKFLDGAFADSCFVVNGRTSIGELSDIVHTKMQLDPLAEMQFFVAEQMLPHDKLLMKVYKDHISSDGFLDIQCRVVAPAEN